MSSTISEHHSVSDSHSYPSTHSYSQPDSNSVPHSPPDAQQGGILYVKKSASDKIENTIPSIIQNASSIKSMGHDSLYGFNLKVSIPTEKSRFLGTHLNDVGTIKRNFLIKFTLLSDKEHYWVLLGDSYTKNPQNPLRDDAKLTGKYADFYSEVKTQQDIFIRTSYLGYPACPPIVAAREYKDKEMLELVRNIVSSCGTKTAEGQCDRETDTMFRRIEHILKHNEFFERTSSLFMDTSELTRKSAKINVSLGVIVMELLEDYKTLSEHRPQSRLIPSADELLRAKTAYAHALYGCIRLLSIGYYHGDIHSSNVMVNLKDTNYLGTSTPYNGHAMMIDFGRTTKITDENALKRNPIYIFFTETFPRIHMNATTFKQSLSLLLKTYVSRNEDNDYYKQNHVRPENTFFSEAGFKRFFKSHTTMNEIIDILFSIIHARRERLQKLKETMELHRIINLPRIKGKYEMIDIFGKLSHLQYSSSSYMDLDLVLYYKQDSMATLRENREIMREINTPEKPYPSEYNRRLKKGIKGVIKRK